MEISFGSVNRIIKNLKNNGYIEYNGTTRGKFTLTDKARVIITQIREEWKKSRWINLGML